MNPILSYIIVGATILALARAAYTHLNQGSRTHRSLLTPIKIEDIEINNNSPTNAPTIN